VNFKSRIIKLIRPAQKIILDGSTVDMVSSDISLKLSTEYLDHIVEGRVNDDWMIILAGEKKDKIFQEKQETRFILLQLVMVWNSAHMEENPIAPGIEPLEQFSLLIIQLAETKSVPFVMCHN
jgi:hypothetical protein